MKDTVELRRKLKGLMNTSQGNELEELDIIYNNVTIWPFISTLVLDVHVLASDH